MATLKNNNCANDNEEERGRIEFIAFEENCRRPDSNRYDACIEGF